MPFRAVAALLAAATGVALLTLGLLDSRLPGTTTTVTRPAAAQPGPDLRAAIEQVAAGHGARVGVAVVGLGAGSPQFTYGADETFTAASTYKLPALMAEAELIAAGRARPEDNLCFRSEEAEDGWFDDYNDGDCLTVQEVATRIGAYSDNTAAHMLVDAIGGGDALNAYARSRGARASAFYEPNQTTAGDLAGLLASEAEGHAGGAAAQQWLYPLLTRTRYEAGIPAGVPAGATVVHKVGFIDQVVNDAGIVSYGGTRYVVAIMSEGAGGDEGWSLVAQISNLIWKQETGTLR